MKVYKIKHKNTGLFFIPSRHIRNPKGHLSGENQYIKSNWSKTGKIYATKGRANSAIAGAISMLNLQSPAEIEIIEYEIQS
jgi:hypothetical protein